MKRITPIITVIFFFGCSYAPPPDFFNESKTLLLRNESDLNEIVSFYEKSIQVLQFNEEENKKEFDLYKRTNTLLAEIEKQIGNDNPAEEFRQLFLDSILVNILNTFTEYKVKIEIIDVDDTAIMRLQKSIEFLKIKGDIYRNLYDRILGCFTMNKPSVYLLKDSTKTQIIFGILDTLSNLKNKIEVTSVSLNGKKIKIPFKIEDKSFYQEIVFFPKSAGKYDWDGNYKILLSTGNFDKIPFSGKFEVGNLSEQLKE